MIQIEGNCVLRREYCRLVERLSYLDYRVSNLVGRNPTAFQFVQHILRSLISKNFFDRSGSVIVTD